MERLRTFCRRLQLLQRLQLLWRMQSLVAMPSLLSDAYPWLQSERRLRTCAAAAIEGAWPCNKQSPEGRTTTGQSLGTIKDSRPLIWPGKVPITGERVGDSGVHDRNCSYETDQKTSSFH
ncbi:hypothetical protein L596_030134 [Steinernema carpocapsae]|uniref:Uncharacterized protein n=1 Tax=Steinernema carpocapsae TaxID=34508 RepID=A0A4U5LRU0_STECR|nr:hypothetical protein L596_030134 [Steinernema carpocapsae]